MTTTQNTQIKKYAKPGRVPVERGEVLIQIQLSPELELTAQKIAHLQDVDRKPATRVKPLVKLFTDMVHDLCKSYSPMIEKDARGNASYIHSTCASGSKGIRYAGSKCLNCTLFNQDFHPRFSGQETVSEEPSVKADSQAVEVTFPDMSVIEQAAVEAPYWW